MTDFATLLIVGAAVSLLVQWLKSSFGTSSWKTLSIVIAVSLAASGAYVFFANSPYWETFVKVLVGAGAVYTYIIQRFEVNS